VVAEQQRLAELEDPLEELAAKIKPKIWAAHERRPEMADPSTYAIRQHQALAQIRSVMENHPVEAGQYPLFRLDGRLPSSP
jgi:hypothetical protein